MKTFDEIRSDLAEGRIELTVHSLKRIVQRNISRREIVEAASKSKIIEDYPEDKYYPSCLILGFARSGRPLHLHVSRVPGPDTRLITIYEPNPEEWVDNFSNRK
ncbi:MAG: DUF4258 domain-containing protein [Bacteroidota bacterium]|nr:DUF4258 domain-containing protein [Bacteroidota bacterium]MDP4242619.1 DUF4258 domain-containing protein [Bacteroidota bacterium]MDP4286819.1 DUF4258 domain-containing protein [Bacteroidota bacterium]